MANHLTRVERAVARHVPRNDPLFIASMRPGLYPLLGRVSPVWEIYFLWVAEVEREQRMIRRLDGDGVDWALVTRDLLDGRSELFLENSHPRVWQHLEREFEPVAAQGLPPDYRLLRRRGSRLRSER